MLLDAVSAHPWKPQVSGSTHYNETESEPWMVVQEYSHHVLGGGRKTRGLRPAWDTWWNPVSVTRKRK